MSLLRTMAASLRVGSGLKLTTVLCTDERTRTQTHGILIAQWKLLPSDQTIIYVSARRRGPCRLVLRESARVIKTSLRLEELGLIRRSLARGAPSHNFPARFRHARTQPSENGDTFISESPWSLSPWEAGATSRLPPSQQESISAQPASHPSCQLELHSQFGNVGIWNGNSSSIDTERSEPE